jgi:ABC-2 type transport system ATP-binding protein
MIEAVGLTKRYGATLAVDDLSFSVRPGVVTGFLGPNGAGKSTTMRMILGLDNPSAGKALVDGVPYAQIKNPLTRIGSLLDANWIHPNRSGGAHLRWIAASNGIPRSRVDEVLDVVGLTAVAGKGAGKYSLGMKQRLGIAGALLGRPEILMFDEPVNGLDPEGILWIRNFMKSLAAEGKTVLVSSHLLSEMALTADHLVVIGRGRLIADSSTKDFISSSIRVRSPQLPQLQQVLAGAGIHVTADAEGLTVGNAPIEQIGDLAAANGLTLHELSIRRGSLEDAFISLTGGAVEYAAHPDAGHGTPAAVLPGSPEGR